MSQTPYFIYIAWNSTHYTVNFSWEPLLDLKYHHLTWGAQYLQLLSPALPVGISQYILEKVTSEKERILSRKDTYNEKINILKFIKKRKEKNLVTYKKSLVKKELDNLKIKNNSYNLLNIAACKNIRLPTEKDKEEILNILKGRILLLDEIKRETKTNFSLENILQILYLEGKVKILPSIGIDSKEKPFCMRCGGTKKIEPIICFDCGNSMCSNCEECLSMGESKICKPLYCAERNEKSKFKEVEIALNFSLTLAQKDASEKLTQFLSTEKTKEALVWAVCGAGKTEVTYFAIRETLKNGGNVLYAVPRRQVIIELAERFRKVFKDLDIVALYGGSQEIYKENSLVMATTHQALRFYKNFDLVVLDEIDAYPYRENRMLHFAVERASKENAKIIYLTATPDKKLLKKVKRNSIFKVTIPARHHGYPVPVPEIRIERELSFKNETVNIPQGVLEKIHLSLEGDLAQIFIFVPTINLTEKIATKLQELLKLPPFNNFAGDWVQYSHSKDPERDIKIKSFMAGEFPILVTTTIMERGITVPRANVIVLFADYEKIFDTGTLVQMAGRSGRLKEYPNGKVWFIAQKNTASMAEAVLWIKNMNLEAFKKGYLNKKSVIE